MMPSEVINGKLMHMATEQIPGKGEVLSRAIRVCSCSPISWKSG